MDAQRTPATVSRGRVLAFRIIAGILAVFVIVSNIAFSVPQFFSETDKVHSFHDLAAMPAFLILLGFALIVMALRPDDVVALRVAWAVALGMVIAGVIGHDFISGSYFFNVIVLIVLTVLAPTRNELLRFGSPNVAMLSLAIVADTSGSMRGRNWERANDFVDQLVSGLTKPNDEVALFTFDKTLCQQTPFTSDRDSVLDALRSVEAWGQTSLYDAVAEAAKRVAVRSGQRRAVLVITDGVDTSSTMTAAEVSAIAGSIDVPVYAISVTPASTSAPTAGDGQAGLAQLVAWTGGDVSYLSESAGLDRTIGALMSELRQQYFLAIQSDSTSGWHRIDVKTRRRDLSVRARTGYFASGL